jgi:N-acetylglutamate synthase-like GNAT family acetyltransferase
MEEARRLQIMRLYLWTPSADGLYAKLGWASLERLDYCGYKISIMHKELCAQFSA